MSEKILVAAEKLENFCNAILQKAGLSGQNARIVTESLLYADLRGVSSHGVARLTTYLDRVKAGAMVLDPTMELEKDLLASALLNAQNGFGQIAGTKAMTYAIEKAKTTGSSVVAVKNSNHFGVAAFYAMQAVKKNMIGLVITNSSPAMAAYNTKKPLVGTNPLAIGIPTAKERPIILDMSTSVVARGKIRRASLAGEKIPFGWARDVDGNPTDDPKAALKGFMEPLGGPKGAGLSLVIDLLCGVLTGSGITGEVKNITDVSGPSKTGHLFIAINVEKFINLDFFKTNVDTVIKGIKESPSVDGSPVYLPGEIECILADKRQVEGIPVPEDVINELAGLAERFAIPKL